MGTWIKEHGVDTVLGVLAIVGVAGVVSFSKEVSDLWRDHPWPMAFCCLLAFALGTWFYHSQGWRETLVERRREERKARREAAEADERRRRAARRALLDLEPWEKGLLLRLRDGVEVVPEELTRRDIRDLLEGLDGLVEYTAVSGNGDLHRWRVSLSEYGRYACEVAGDVLEEVLKYEDEE